MTQENVIRKVSIEEIVGICLGKAPYNFYNYDEDGNAVSIKLSEVEWFAKKADERAEELGLY